MEVKKSHKADLERLRPYVFVASLVGVTLFFVAVLFFPYRSVGQWLEEAFEDTAMDLDIKPKEDDYISAAKPQQQIQPKEAQKFNKVDEATEQMPELPEPVKEEVDPNKEQIEDVPPINLNEDDEEALKIVEELPEYPGGMVEFVKWLTATLKYPPAALRQKIEGKVMVSFIVNKDGSLSDIKISQSANKLLDNEALRVARMMPKWKPGTEDGKPCRTKIAIPIVFAI